MTFRTEFADLTGWTNQGGVSISPAGWAYHGGDGNATGYIYRTIAAGESYFETRVYLDQNSDNWMMMKVDAGGNNLYNSGAADGVGLAVRGNGQGFTFWDGTKSGWGGTFTVSPRPGDASTACIIGIERIGSTKTIYDFYLNGVLLGRQSSSIARTNTIFALGGYNGVGAHFDYAYAGVRDIFVTYPSPMVMG